jgi:hypothetical protein
MPGLEIEKLTLKVSGLSEAEGRRLVRLVAEGLADQPFESGGDRAGLQSSQIAPKGASAESLARRIVEDLLRQLDRTV